MVQLAVKLRTGCDAEEVRLAIMMIDEVEAAAVVDPSALARVARDYFSAATRQMAAIAGAMSQSRTLANIAELAESNADYCDVQQRFIAALKGAGQEMPE